MPPIKGDIAALERSLGELHIDRGYIASPIVSEILDGGGLVICKPRVPQNGDLYSKADFKLNLRSMSITCPPGRRSLSNWARRSAFPASVSRVCAPRPMHDQRVAWRP